MRQTHPKAKIDPRSYDVKHSFICHWENVPGQLRKHKIGLAIDNDIAVELIDLAVLFSLSR